MRRAGASRTSPEAGPGPPLAPVRLQRPCATGPPTVCPGRFGPAYRPLVAPITRESVLDDEEGKPVLGGILPVHLHLLFESTDDHQDSGVVPVVLFQGRELFGQLGVGVIPPVFVGEAERTDEVIPDLSDRRLGIDPPGVRSNKPGTRA